MTLAYSLYKLRTRPSYVAVRIVELKGKSFLQSSAFTERSIFSEAEPSNREMTLALNYFCMFNIETIYIYANVLRGTKHRKYIGHVKIYVFFITLHIEN